MLDDIIRFGLKSIFEMFEYDSHKAYTIKLTRDAEIDIDDDVTQSFIQKITESIKQRQTGEPVRFVYDRNMPKELLSFILKKIELKMSSAEAAIIMPVILSIFPRSAPIYFAIKRKIPIGILKSVSIKVYLMQ